tara:strand:+ start:1464 stop:2594 length:1131 start_codon:yes stop_codon:yes gene_type:complete
MDKFKSPIPYMKHNITKEDIDAVTEVLKSDFLTQGPYVTRVEESMALITQKEYGVMCSNGTAALHLVAEMLNQDSNLVSKNIVTTPLTFVADANFGRYINADIKFADVNKDSWTVDPEQIDLLIDENTIAVVAPHYAGLMCDMESISKICKEKKVFLVEDACHAPKSTIKGKPAGSFGDVSTFSFHATKHIGAGEGGAICTNSFEEYEKLNVLRSHGLPHWSKRTGFGYDIDKLAFNYRPSEMGAALALSHIDRIDELIRLRKKIAKIYDDKLNWEYFDKQIIPNEYDHVYHLYPVLLPTRELREKCLEYLKDANIFAQIHYPPINHMKGFQQFKSNTPFSDEITSRVISIPMFTQLTNNEIEFVIDKLNNFSRTN